MKASDFWNHMVETPDGCWEWTLSKNSAGYGSVKYKGFPWLAHRLAWTFYFGEIPDGMYVCHKCDNKPCCNPRHMFLGSQSENLIDMRDKGRRKWDTCAKGENQGSAKLKEADILAIRKDSRKPLRLIADDYGVSIQQVWSIQKRKSWKHVPEERLPISV